MIATDSFTVDTNILIYSADRHDLQKRSLAERVVLDLFARRLPLPLQCLSEFYKVTTQKRKLSSEDAELIVRQAMSFAAIVPASTQDLLSAVTLHQQYQLQFFDALLLATAARAGCSTLFSEDFQHNRSYGSITVRNPYRLSSAELDLLLA